MHATATAGERGIRASMLLSTALVATSFPVSAAVAGALDSRSLTLLRFLLAALLFLPLVLRRHGRAALPGPRALARYALLSAPLVGFFAAMFEALRTTSPLNTGALFTLAPAFAALFSLLLGGERGGPRRLPALALGVLGALWVLVGGRVEQLRGLAPLPGDGLFLVGTASLGLYSALVRRLHRGEPMEVMTLWTLVTGACWLSLSSPSLLLELAHSRPEPVVLLATGYLALFTTLVTFFLTQRASARLGATATMAFTYLNPALVALLAWPLEGRAPGWASLPGVVLAASAVALLQRPGPSRENARSPVRSGPLPVMGRPASLRSVRRR